MPCIELFHIAKRRADSFSLLSRHIALGNVIHVLSSSCNGRAICYGKGFKNWEKFDWRLLKAKSNSLLHVCGTTYISSGDDPVCSCTTDSRNPVGEGHHRERRGTSAVHYGVVDMINHIIPANRARMGEVQYCVRRLCGKCDFEDTFGSKIQRNPCHKLEITVRMSIGQ